MPEFILNTPAAPIRSAAIQPRQPHAFYSLDEFARGYVEAMFFTNGDTGDDDESRLNDMGVERLTIASVAAIKRDCSRFLSTVASDGRFARQILDSVDDYDDEQAGRDFWFTRQGHGVGFWDRKPLEASDDDSDEYERLTSLMVEANERRDSAAWDAALAERDKLKANSPGALLSGCAGKFGESYVEIYRGWIHIR